MAHNTHEVLAGIVKVRIKDKWKSRWCTLTWHTPSKPDLTGTSSTHIKEYQLCFYKSNSEQQQKKKEKQCITLKDYLGVRSGFSVDGEKNCLSIILISQTILLSLCSPEYQNWWEKTLREIFGQHYDFPAVLTHSPPSVQIPQPQVNLVFHRKTLGLTFGIPPIVLLAWQLAHLRRYSDINKKFCLEAGLSAGKGSGVFAFITEHASALTALLKDAGQSDAINQSSLSIKDEYGINHSRSKSLDTTLDSSPKKSSPVHKKSGSTISHVRSTYSLKSSANTSPLHTMHKPGKISHQRQFSSPSVTTVNHQKQFSSPAAPMSPSKYTDRQVYMDVGNLVRRCSQDDRIDSQTYPRQTKRADKGPPSSNSHGYVNIDGNSITHSPSSSQSTIAEDTISLSSANSEAVYVNQLNTSNPPVVNQSIPSNSLMQPQTQPSSFDPLKPLQYVNLEEFDARDEGYLYWVDGHGQISSHNPLPGSRHPHTAANSQMTKAVTLDTRVPLQTHSHYSNLPQNSAAVVYDGQIKKPLSQQSHQQKRGLLVQPSHGPVVQPSHGPVVQLNHGLVVQPSHGPITQPSHGQLYSQPPAARPVAAYTNMTKFEENVGLLKSQNANAAVMQKSPNNAPSVLDQNGRPQAYHDSLKRQTKNKRVKRFPQSLLRRHIAGQYVTLRNSQDPNRHLANLATGQSVEWASRTATHSSCGDLQLVFLEYNNHDDGSHENIKNLMKERMQEKQQMSKQKALRDSNDDLPPPLPPKKKSPLRNNPAFRMRSNELDDIPLTQAPPPPVQNTHSINSFAGSAMPPKISPNAKSDAKASCDYIDMSTNSLESDGEIYDHFPLVKQTSRKKLDASIPLPVKAKSHSVSLSQTVPKPESFLTTQATKTNPTAAYFDMSVKSGQGKINTMPTGGQRCQSSGGQRLCSKSSDNVDPLYADECPYLDMSEFESMSIMDPISNLLVQNNGYITSADPDVILNVSSQHSSAFPANNSSLNTTKLEFKDSSEESLLDASSDPMKIFHSGSEPSDGSFSASNEQVLSQPEKQNAGKNSSETESSKSGSKGGFFSRFRRRSSYTKDPNGSKTSSDTDDYVDSSTISSLSLSRRKSKKKAEPLYAQIKESQGVDVQSSPPTPRSAPTKRKTLHRQSSEGAILDSDFSADNLVDTEEWIEHSNLTDEQKSKLTAFAAIQSMTPPTPPPDIPLPPPPLPPRPNRPLQNPGAPPIPPKTYRYSRPYFSKRRPDQPEPEYVDIDDEAFQSKELRLKSTSQVGQDDFRDSGLSIGVFEESSSQAGSYHSGDALMQEIQEEDENFSDMNRGKKLKAGLADGFKVHRRKSGQTSQRFLQEHPATSEGSSCSITPSPSPQPSHASVFTFDSLTAVSKSTRLTSSSETGSPSPDSPGLTVDTASGGFYDPDHVYMNINFASKRHSPRSRSPGIDSTSSRIGVDAADYANISLNYAELDHTPSGNAPRPRTHQPVAPVETVEYASIDMVATKAAIQAGKEHAQQREQQGQRMTNGMKSRSPSVIVSSASPSSSLRKARKGVMRSHSSASRTHNFQDDKM